MQPAHHDAGAQTKTSESQKLVVESKLRRVSGVRVALRAAKETALIINTYITYT
jgi:hypothetical protein